MNTETHVEKIISEKIDQIVGSDLSSLIIQACKELVETR